MKRLMSLVLVLAAVAMPALAQQKTESSRPPGFEALAGLKNRVFEIKHRDPNSIASAIRLLGSGLPGAELSVNVDLQTITVRDYPENIATIAEAITRLDRAPADVSNIDLKISVLIGSKSPVDGPPLPEDLAPVVKQLQATLRYQHYGLMTVTVHRAKPGVGFEGSGVAEPTMLGMKDRDGVPLFYSYRLRRISVPNTERPAVDVENFAFSMKVPVMIEGKPQYQNVGFESAVSIRQNEKVVIGTSAMGDKALIVVATANVLPPDAK